jgi:hypothetical protein
MRDVPTHISKAIRRDYPETAIRWDMRTHQWKLFWRGRPRFALMHADGTPVMELYESEVLRILRESDNWRRGADPLRAFDRFERNRVERAERTTERRNDEASQEGRARVKTLVRGPQTWVNMQGTR